MHTLYRSNAYIGISPRSIKYETAVLIFKVENIIICSSVSRVGWTSGVSLGLSCAYTHHEPMRPTAVATVYVSCQTCESPSEKFLSVCTRRSMIVLCLDWPGDYIRLPSIRTQRATVCGPLIYTRNFVYFIWSEKFKNTKIHSGPSQEKVHFWASDTVLVHEQSALAGALKMANYT